MPKELEQPRPSSSISDILESDVIERATRSGAPQKDDGPQAQPVKTQDTVKPPSEVDPSRTGEHTDIQKMYRLTPSAYSTLRQLSRAFSDNLGFDVANSAVMRAMLIAMNDAVLQIERIACERLQSRRQLSTAIGNEHARDQLEAELAEIIRSGMLAAPV